MVGLRCTMVTSAPADCSSWQMSCALVPVPNTTTERPDHSLPAANWLECRILPAKFSSRSMLGMFGAPLQLDGGRNPGMAAADNENVAVAIPVGGRRLPLLEPIRTGKIPHPRFACGMVRARRADPVEIEHGGDCPRRGKPARDRQQPQ